MEPLLARLTAAIGSGEHPAEEVQKRIRILRSARRALSLKHFEAAARSLLERKRLRITYYNRARDDETTREISPQRLVHYRDNWYLDAWCHLRQDIRSFAVDAIRAAEILEQPARDVAGRELDEVLAEATASSADATRSGHAALLAAGARVGCCRAVASRPAGALRAGRILRSRSPVQ